MSDTPSGNTFKEVLPKVMQTVRASSSLAAQDVNFYKSLDANLSSDLDKSAKSLLSISNNLINNASDDAPSIIFGKDNITSDVNWNPVANVLDNIFEKIDIAFDHAQKARYHNNNNNESSNRSFTYLEDSNGTEENSSRHPGKRMVKPQLNFRNTVDNSESHPFKPKITSKPNSIKSFEESIKLIEPKDESSEESDPAFYPQPYEHEIDNQPYPEAVLTKSEPIASKPWLETAAIWVDTVDELKKMIESLSEQSEIAVDLEHHDYRSYYGIVCLMQISSRDQDWIVDTLALRDDLEILNTVFTNPNIVKVFHGAFMDIIWLQRDLGLYIVSLFDTYHASKKLGFPKFSLAYLLETFANFKTSKKYQLADWRIRPLLSPMLAYARSDTHFLLNIYDQLKNKLIDIGSNRLQEVLFESRQVAKRRFEYTKYRPLSASGGKVSCPTMANNPKEPYSSIMAQYNVPYHKKLLIEALYNWRDLIAKRDDESVRYVMPNQLLVSLSLLNHPVDAQKVLGVSNYIPDYVRLNAKTLSNLIEETLKKMEENDWDLVDKWNSAPDVIGDDITNFDDDEIDKIRSRSKAFDRLFEEKTPLLAGKDNNKLLIDKSILFSEIFKNGRNLFSVEYDIQQNKAVPHTVGNYKERLNYTMEKFKETNKTTVLDNLAKSTSTEKIDNNKDKESPIVANEESIVVKEKELDPNEVITLRKRNKNQKNQNTKEEFVAGPSFDYANADKILLETANRKNSRKKEPKKRSFDPYSKEAEGPQGAKKTRKLNTGKTSTFSNKKK